MDLSNPFYSAVRNDFYHMRRGRSISALSDADMALIKPIAKVSEKKHSALILLHGFTSTPAVFRLMKPLFADYDTVICPALPGHASSIKDLSNVHYQDWLLAAEQCVREIAQTFENIDVVGFSLGGLLASHISHYVRLNHLYLIAPAFDLPYPISLLLKLTKGLKSLGFNLLRNAAGDLLSNEHTEIAYRKVPVTAIIELLTLLNEQPPALPNCPTDVFLGRYDHVISSERVAKRFSSVSCAQVHWLNESAHAIPLESDRYTIIQCIKRYQKQS